MLLTGDPQILQLQKKTERSLGKCPSGSKWHFGWWYEPCARPPAAAWCTKSPGIQNHLWRRWVPWPERPPSWGPRWAEAGAACSKANGWGHKKLLVVENFRGIPGRPPKFGAKIHHFRSNPELVDRYTSFSHWLDYRWGWDTPSCCTIFLQQSTGPVYKAA